jgi:hypothetical protein
LKVQNSDSTEILLHPPNSRDAVQSWLNISHPESNIEYSGSDLGIVYKTESSCGVIATSESNSVVLPPKATKSPTGNSHLEPRYLHFRSKATILTIAPDAETSNASSDLRNYRILQGTTWIGTIFVTPECAKIYPTVTHGCEFVELSCFGAYPRNFNFLWEDLPVSSRTPILFDIDVYKQAVLEYKIENRQRKGACPRKRRRSSSDSYEEEWVVEGKDGVRSKYKDPGPPKMDLSHIMWIKRIGDVCYRIAVGLAYRKTLEGKWHPEEMFCVW